MNEYLDSILKNHITPKSPREYLSPVPYEGKTPGVLWPKEESELIDEVLNLSFEK